MKSRAYVAAAGVRTALGQNAVQTAMLLRTGVAAIAAAPLVDAAGEQVTMCFDPTIDPYLVGEERAAALALPALEEALAALGEAAGVLSMRLLLCVNARAPVSDRGPLGRAEFRAAPGALLAARVHARARELAPGIALDVAARGPASAAFALPKALDDLGARRLDAIVLGGVHSDYDPEVIAALSAAGRLFSPENLDALIPGEAAAFVILTREETARRAGLRPAARINGLGTGMARARPDNDESSFEPSGLIAAVRGATEEMTQHQLRVGWTLTDHTFETRRVDEWQAMMTRTHTLWGDPHCMESPGQRLGHLGAAAMPLLMALAAEGWRRGYAPSGMALCLAGSDAGERGALLMLTNM